jgi:hypothetical protein
MRKAVAGSRTRIERKMTPESAVKKLLDFAGRVVLFDIDGLEAAVEAAEKRLPPPGDLAYKLALADLEMAKRVLTYTAAYSRLLKHVTRDYRLRFLQAGAAADSAKG